MTRARPPEDDADDGRGFEILDDRLAYDGFFKLRVLILRHRRFAGGRTPAIERERFGRGHAAAVLPYDPARGRVLMIEQFRAGAIDDPLGPWLLEPVAGLFEPGEAPEATARREAREEAGLDLGALARVAGFYPTPGCMLEFDHVFVGHADLPDAAAGLFGLPDEHEDIRARLFGLDEALDLVRRGVIRTAPGIVALQWLALNRAALDDAWCRAGDGSLDVAKPVV